MVVIMTPEGPMTVREEELLPRPFRAVGRAPALPISEDVRAREEAERRLVTQKAAAETARKVEEERRIESEKRAELFQAQQRYQQDIRGITTIQERQARLQQYLGEVSRAEALHKVARVEAGIITAARIPLADGEVRITPETVAEFREAMAPPVPERLPPEVITPPEMPPLPPEELPWGERFKRRLEERYPFYAKFREEAKRVAEWVERRVPRPTLREGETVYMLGGKVYRKLPYGMTPFSRGVDWYKIREGRLEPIERPVTAVEAISRPFWEAAEVIERLPKAIPPSLVGISPIISPIGVPTPGEVERAWQTKIEITPEIYDLPGQVGLMYFFAPTFQEMKAAKKVAKTKVVKKISTAKAEKARRALEKIMKEGLKSKEAKVLAEKRIATDLSKYVKKAIAMGDDPEVVMANVKDIIQYGRDRGFFMYERMVTPPVPKVKPPTPPLPPPPVPGPPEIPIVRPGIPAAVPPEVIPSIYAGLGVLRGYERALTPEQELEYLRQERWLKRKSLAEYGRPEVEIKEFPAFVAPETRFAAPAEVSMFTGTAPEGKFKTLMVGISPRVTPLISARERARLAEEERLRERLRQVSFLRAVSITRLAQPTVARPALAVAAIPALAQVPRLRIRFAQPLIPRVVQVPRVPRIPRIPVPIPLLRLKPPRREVLVRRRPPIREPVFTAEVKRRGKWIPVGKTRTPGAAALVGRARVMQTLAASLRVLKDSIPVMLPTTQFFRRGKVDPFALVQKKIAIGAYRGRLTTPGERLEIKRARQSGSSSSSGKKYSSTKSSPFLMFKKQPAKSFFR